MSGNDFTRGGISCGLKQILPFSLLLRLYQEHRIPALIIFILSIPCVSFAQSPTLTGIEAAALNYDEEQASTAITNSLIASDADSPLLTSATVQISSNYSGTEDLLQFTNAFSITGSYDGVTGTLTLTGPASPADFTSALRSVTYQNINNNNPSNLLRTVSISVNDGSSNSLIVIRDIQVNRINDAPIGQQDTFVMYEDTELDCGCLLINDIDPDGDNLVAYHDQNPSNGTVSDLGGFLIYTPNPNFYGTDTFTYFANDGTQNSDPIIVHITVLPVNDSPIAANDAVTTDEDAPISIPMLSNDTDVDDLLNVSMIVPVTTPTHGALNINTTTGVVTYTPTANFYGNDSFTYQVKDASGALSNTATVNIAVSPVNDAPVANPDFATTPEDVPVSIAVLLNDTDIDNVLNGSSLLVVTTPANGTAFVQLTTGMILYTPKKDFTGTDSFTYSVKDPSGATSAPSTVTVTVSPVNDPPVAVNDEATSNKNIPAEVNILHNDYDVDDQVVPTSVIFTTNPAHGTIAFNSSTGVMIYTPQPDFAGNDSFSYTIQDPSGLTSAPATISVTVEDDPNRPPHAEDDGPIVNTFLSPISIDVLSNDYDEDNTHDELSIVSVTNPAVGTVKIMDGKIVYQPAGLISVTVTFTYAIQDPEGLTDEATVTIENSFLPLIVSEGFSPNNDNNNETWYIQGIENYPDNLVKVFDRWGFLVYQKQHYQNNISPWDGRGNTEQQAGKLLEQGTYYYILEPGNEIKTMTGYVVIVR